MGMFDTFYFKDYKLTKKLLSACIKASPAAKEELSFLEIQTTEYQTKDLNNGLETYFLKKCGRKYKLYRRDIEYVHIQGDQSAESVMDRIGHMEEVSSTDVEVDDIGTNTITVYNRFEQEKYDYWIDFDVIFIDGFLSEVKIKSIEARDNSDKKTLSLKLEEMIKKDQEFAKTFLGKLYKTSKKIYYKTLWKAQNRVGRILVGVGNWFMYRRLF